MRHTRRRRQVAQDASQTPQRVVRFGYRLRALSTRCWGRWRCLKHRNVGPTLMSLLDDSLDELFDATQAIRKLRSVVLG